MWVKGMKFDKGVYRDRRKKGFRGQIPVPGTKEFNYEQRKIDKLAHKLRLEKMKADDDQKEIKEVK